MGMVEKRNHRYESMAFCRLPDLTSGREPETGLPKELLLPYLSVYPLTKRELDILYAISYYGDSNEELGIRLKISPHTVKNHVSKILVKMKIRSVREAQAFLLRCLIHYL